jgi:hypothetical protein
MAELKTRVTKASVTKFLDGIADEKRRRDCMALLEMMEAATKAKPEMWGPSIVGFGRYAYRYPNGKDAEWFVVGFSPRKANLTLYILPGVDRYADHLEKLGRHTTGRSCLYVKTLDDLHLPTLKAMLKTAFKEMPKARATS